MFTDTSSLSLTLYKPQLASFILDPIPFLQPAVIFNKKRLDFGQSLRMSTVQKDVLTCEGDTPL